MHFVLNVRKSVQVSTPSLPRLCGVYSNSIIHIFLPTLKPSMHCLCTTYDTSADPL